MRLRNSVLDLVEDMNSNLDAVIVEGKRDKMALERANFEKRIYTCSDTNGLVSFSRKVSRENDRIAILTDFDSEGRDLNSKLRRLIPGNMVSSIWRKKLGNVLTNRGHRDVESINNIVSRV